VDRVLARLSRLHPKVIDLSLDRVWRLLGALNHPEMALPPVFHVAGTNGKGSTTATLRAILEAGRRRVHVYSSPHLVRFAERIRLAGKLIDEDALIALLEECERVNGEAPITFFEVTTIAAFLAFSRTPADAVVLETGLGGRLDATNVLSRPACTIITPVSIDHQAFLGDSLAEIAGEKAGILKAGVPCILAHQEPEALSVISERAAVLGAPLFLEERDWRVEALGTEGMVYQSAQRRLELPRPALPGAHQIHNAGLALAALEQTATFFALDAEDLALGLLRVDWPARLQQLAPNRPGQAAHPFARTLPANWELWLDGGHNEGAGQMLAAHAAASWGNRPLHLVVGMINTKDPTKFLAPLAPLAASVTLLTIPGEANALSAETLAEAAQRAGLRNISTASSAEAALKALADSASPPSRALICGSLYLAGSVLARAGDLS